MKFHLPKELFQTALSKVSGSVQRTNVIDILSNVLIRVEDKRIQFTCNDLESQMSHTISLDVENIIESGATTVPAKKLIEIVKTSPPGVKITFTAERNKATLSAGRSRFTLQCISADRFPEMEKVKMNTLSHVNAGLFKTAIDQVSYAMAVADHRYYLNGMLIEVADNTMKLVATDGHRLGLTSLPITNLNEDYTILAPRKSILEISRLVNHIDSDSTLTISSGSNFFQIETDDFSYTSKLIDGKFPDYNRVIPANNDVKIVANKNELRTVLNRVAVLSNEKYNAVRLNLKQNEILVTTNNTENEEAEEFIEVDYEGSDTLLCFNVKLLTDAISSFSSEKVSINIRPDSLSSVLVRGTEESHLAIVMPVRP